MGSSPGPAVIIVVRHGARLDAADPQWHLTSPTPYDPPLTYGGWSQSKSLGARIANILRNREVDEEIHTTCAASLGTKDRSKRKHKIVIHTSPYLRCIQTSIGIGAGLAQNYNANSSPSKNSIDCQGTKPKHSSPLTRPSVTGSPILKPIHEPLNLSLEKNKGADQSYKIKRCTLRIDAFLGEWLTPDYFDQITPPPSSYMLITAAKADLLRREDYTNLIHMKDYKANKPFPGGWGSSNNLRDTGAIEDEKNKVEGPISNSSPLNSSPHNRDRSASLISSGSHGGRHRGLAPQVEPPGSQDAHGVYQPPIPSYAISASDPIPPGYVSHARDACIEVDYQWDSMRDPLNWSNGGEYGEEWSTMHKRFRAGLQNLVEWYQKSNETSKMLTRYRSNSLRLFSPEDEAANEDTDLVVILVTHGAGCNALIGALTNQPVLLDVGMASLTMAVRHSSSSGAASALPSAANKKFSISDQYEVKLLANNEHLRNSRSSTPSASRTPSVSGLSSIRERVSNLGLTDHSIPTKSRPHNSCLGSIRRTASVTTGHKSKPYIPIRVNSIGLWTAPRYCDEIEEDDMILNFGNNDVITDSKSALDKKASTEKKASVSSKEIHDHDDTKWGLWSTCKTTNSPEKICDTALKRRWTIDERDSMIGLGQTT